MLIQNLIPGKHIQQCFDHLVRKLRALLLYTDDDPIKLFHFLI